MGYVGHPFMGCLGDWCGFSFSLYSCSRLRLMAASVKQESR